MENNDIKTVDELLNNWKIINLDFYNSKIKINNSFLDNISTLNSKNELSVSIDNILDCHIDLNSLLIQRELGYYNDILDKYIQTSKISIEKNRNYSCDFNVFSFFNITEPTHSYLISFLLNPNSSHGQGDLFLKTFLNLIGIEKPETGQWIVTAETGRIDILLKRFEPHCVVVIENKSNYAKDQENQLYRYWFQEIYYPNRHKNIEFANDHPEKYQLIYLTPASWKLPNDNTLSKPTDWSSDLPDRIPMKPKIMEFTTDIVNWLENSIEKIPLTNNRLREYIKQYIELWT